MNESNSDLSRRGFMAAGGAGLALAALAKQGPVAHAAEMTATEKANLDVVLKVCKEIEKLDLSLLEPYFADNIQFQLFDGQPIIDGRDAFMKFGAGFFAPYERAEWTVHRSHVIGNIVINERTDNFIAKDGGKDASFHVSGFMVVKNGKIEEWKDYGIPK